MWLARPDAADVDHLTASERERWQRFHRPVDRDRFATGSVLQRELLRAVTQDPGADYVRACPGCGGADHGPVAPSGAHAGRWSLSLSHSGSLVAAAVIAGPAGVGVDVEQRGAEVRGVAGLLCTARERAADDAAADVDQAHLVRWVRKEAILKATWLGLTVPLDDLDVSDHDEPAALRSWAAATRPRAVDATGVSCLDLPAADVGPGYRGAVAAISAGALQLSVTWPER